MSGKNMVLGLWSLNHFTNQNVGFFKLQYVTNVLRYEVEFLNVVGDPK